MVLGLLAYYCTEFETLNKFFCAFSLIFRCGTRLVDDTSDFQFHIRRNHSQDNPAPVFVSDGLQVFERNALEIEGWSDDMKGASSEIT